MINANLKKKNSYFLENMWKLIYTVFTTQWVKWFYKLINNFGKTKRYVELFSINNVKNVNINIIFNKLKINIDIKIWVYSSTTF